MKQHDIKKKFPKLDTNWATSPFIVEVNRNPKGHKVCGSYKEYGGDPERFIQGNIHCPSCDSNSGIASDIIGYVTCNDCGRSYPANQWYVDPEEGKEVFNMIVSEVLSNNDNLARLQEIGEEYNRMYWYLMVKHEPNQGNVPLFILRSWNFTMFRFYAGKNDLNLHSKIVECIAEDFLTKEVYDAYCRFLRCDPTIMRVDGKKMLVVTATPKHDLLNRVKKDYDELKKYRKFAEDYMIDFTEDEMDEDILNEEEEDY